MDAQANMAREDGATARNGYRERGLATPWRHRAAHPPAARGDTFPEGPDREVPAHGPRRRGGRRGVVGRRRLDEEDGADRPGVGIERLSKDRASTMRRSMDAGAAQLVSRDLGEVGFPYIILATHVKCRRDGRVQSTAVAAAIGDGSDGVRRMPGVAAVDAETHAGWLGFLRECGLSGARLVVGDAHVGLVRAIAERLPGAGWQRCVVHLERGACSLLASRRHRAIVDGQQGPAGRLPRDRPLRHGIRIPCRHRRRRRVVGTRRRGARGVRGRRPHLSGLPRRTPEAHTHQQRAGAHKQGDKAQVAGGPGLS